MRPRLLDRAHPDARRRVGVREDDPPRAVGSAGRPGRRVVPCSTVGDGRGRRCAWIGSRDVDRRSTSRHTDARAARHHAGSRTRSRSARGDAGRGSRLVAGRRPGRDRRLPPPRRVRGNGAIRRDARRCCPRRAAAGEPSAPCMGASQGHPVRRGARGAPVRARDEHRRGRARPGRLARGDARARCAGRRLARRRRSRGDGSRRRRRRATLSRGPLRPLRGRDLSWARPDAPHGDRDARCDAARRPGARRDRPRGPQSKDDLRRGACTRPDGRARRSSRAAPPRRGLLRMPRPDRRDAQAPRRGGRRARSVPRATRLGSSLRARSTVRDRRRARRPHARGDRRHAQRGPAPGAARVGALRPRTAFPRADRLARRDRARAAPRTASDRADPRPRRTLGRADDGRRCATGSR